MKEAEEFAKGVETLTERCKLVNL